MLIKKKGAIVDLFPGAPLNSVKPGTKLTLEQSKYLGQVVGGFIKAVQRRRHSLLVHYSLQNTIGGFLRWLRFNVYYEVPFAVGGIGGEWKVFDIVAEKAKQRIVVEVKDEITPQALGQVYGYINAIQLTKEKARVYLGTDILNYFELVKGVDGETVKELMEREQMGVMLADKYALIVFGNSAQLALEEMPEILVSEERAG